ncbi:MAG: cation:proton antiporter [Verrucomicrobiota bacterium]
MHDQSNLLTNIGLCVTMAAVLAVIAGKLRQPLILAYLLAGVVIGPAGLKWIADDRSIHNVAEIGLLLLLFLIGLELDLKKLLAAGKPVILTGLVQFPLCVALGFCFFFALGFRMQPDDYGLLYLPVCLGLSSTMIVVKLLYDKFELNTLPGRITLGVLVCQDIWAIAVLAIQPNLLNPHVGPLAVSLAKSVVLVVAALAVSRWLLPPLFRSVAKQPEVMLVASLAWCFAVCGGASYAGLSREMGALIAGVSMSAYPYSLDVTAKVISIRDFFVTLFFVALGMQIPVPTFGMVGLALLASAFLILSRLVTVFPVLHRLRLDHRASLLPALNLSQISEFSLVIAAIGAGLGHIPNHVVSGLIFVFAITSVVSTYLINYNDTIAQWLSGRIKRAGIADLDLRAEGNEAESALASKDIVLLGFYHEASALVHEWERQPAGTGRYPLLDRLLVIDFNPQVHAELKRRSITCIYGDLAHMETLHHAHIHTADLIVATIPDSILKGTGNRRLLQQARRLCPDAKVVVTAERISQALELYEERADYVFVTQLHSARQRAELIEHGLREGFDVLRADHITELRQRNEVLA